MSRLTADPDILITEDVQGAPIRQLTDRWSVALRPDAWQDSGELASLVSTARALIVRNRTQVTRELLDTASQLQIVARAGVGVDNIDIAAANERGIAVTVPLGANATSVAEHSVGLAIGLARKIVDLDAACRRGQWTRVPGGELCGRTWGLLGAGATGRATGRLAAALGMRVIAYDPLIAPENPDLTAAGIHLTSLEEVASHADILSCHLPATDETRGLIDAALIKRMPPHALLVNVGRGEVLDEEALADALDAGRLGGAALDVRTSEPPSPGRLEKLENVILTPHIGGITAESQHRILQILCTDIDAVLTGRPATYAVGTSNGVRS